MESFNVTMKSGFEWTLIKGEDNWRASFEGDDNQATSYPSYRFSPQEAAEYVWGFFAQESEDLKDEVASVA